MGLEPGQERDRAGSSHRPRHRSSAAPPMDDEMAREVQNARALQVLARVRDKLIGRDFKPNVELNVIDQVEKLIEQATDFENLCQHYIGWCSFW
jgi:serine/threonine-protein kinase mTOR